MNIEHHIALLSEPTVYSLYCGFNLRRHENEYCPLNTQAEREMSEAESSQTVNTETVLRQLQLTSMKVR